MPKISKKNKLYNMLESHVNKESDLEWSGTLKDYIEFLPNKKADLHNFMSKVYSHISMRKP